MIQISKLTEKQANELFAKVINYKKKGWTYEDIIFQCNISMWTTQKIINTAKKKGVKFPNLEGGDYSKHRRVETVEVVEPVPVPISETRTRLLESKKHIPTVKITKHFSVAKDFWLFSK
jgi:hypothetical protein